MMIAELTAPTPAPDAADFTAIFAEQRRRYRAAPTPSLEERKAKLDALERAIRAHRSDLHAALVADFRKSPDETEFTEFVVTMAELKFARDRLASWMKPVSVETPLSLFGSSSEIRYEPKGVVLVLAPWNYPFYLTMVPLIAALAAGNRVILRPSEKTPATSAVIEKVIREAFAPHDVAYVGGEIDTAEALLKLPFDHIFFTGSTRVGKIVMKAAAEHLASVTLELGGKSPCIVAEDADVARAAQRVAWGKYLNGGQTCVAPDYVLVHESIERPFLDATAKAIEKMYGTEAKIEATPDFCRMIDDGHFQRITSLMNATIDGGAHVEAGGKTDAPARYISPTVLSNVTFDAPIMSEEIFGPVLPVITYRSLDDAIAQINARPKPLALYAFTKKSATADTIIDKTSAGGTLVNDTILHLANPNLPFGGIGESGVGSYHGIFGFKAFSHERSIMRQSKASAAPLLAPPYGKVFRMMIKVLEKLP
jgi:aldehyde dehydrogenase (NAD+)